MFLECLCPQIRDVDFYCAALLILKLTTMAACGGLQRLFENKLPENPTPKHLAPWNQINSMIPIDLASITELFEETHFKETPKSPLPNPNQNPPHKIEENQSLDSFTVEEKNHSLGCFTPLNSERLHLCTEGLGFESSDEVENFSERDDGWRNHDKVDPIKHSHLDEDRNFRNCTNIVGSGNGFISSSATGSFPPPISCIGRRGKPCFSLKSYRHDGRLVLREIKIPNHKFLHALREDGRLKLHLFPSTEIFTKEAKGEEEYDDYVDANVEDENDDEEDKKLIATDEICKGHGSPTSVNFGH